MKKISAEEFDRRFDQGEDLTPYLDLASATCLGEKSQRVNVDFPVWMIRAMDQEAARLGISRQALIKVTMDQRLQVRHP